MKRPKILVLALALVVLGAGAWLLVRSRGSKDPGAPAVTAKGGEGGPVARGSAQGAEARDQGGERRGELAILIDDDPVGTLVLEGQVIDHAKDGVGGATVVISSNPPRTTTTEADGSFAFDKLVGRAYEIVARAPEGVAGPITSRLTATSDPVILTLVPASAVTVEVVDDKGAPLDGATVELRDLDVQRATTAAGKAEIRPVVPGGYQLAAWAPGFARSYQWLRVAGKEVSARVALRRGASVAGRVVTEDGAAVAGARVNFGGASDWSVQADDRLDGQVTDADGKFRFEAVGAGSMRFYARHADHAPGTSKIVTLDGATPVEDLAIVLPAGATVAGIVVDGGGNPVPSARVRVGVAGAGFVSAGPRQVFSDEQGAWQVKGLPEKQLEAVAMAEVGSSATVPIDATKGDVAGVKLLVDQTGTIAGIVVDPAGEPIEGVQVSAMPNFRSGGGGDMSAWRLRGRQEELTDSGGRFTLTGLAAGDYRVRASRAGARGGGFGFGPPGSGGTVGAKTGDTDVRIELPLDGGIKGQVAFADGTSPTAFTVAVPWDPAPFATKDGRFELGEIAPGEYDVQIRGTGFAPKVVKATVEGGEVADLGTITVVKGRTIRGTVVAAGAPVPGATVYLGAQIFGNGSSNRAEFGGPPGAQDAKTVTTDDRGGFSISGFAQRDLTIVAEHEEHGRSRAVRLVVGDPAEQALEIVLEPFGSLSGVVTDGGQIVAGNIVSVQSTTAPGASYGVASGEDGAFRLDRLAPDTYRVSAMTGMNPMRGMGFFSKTVTVASGKETTVDVVIQKGAITLAASATAPGAQVAGMAWIVSGAMNAVNGKDLQLKLAASGDSFSTFTVMMLGQPARFRELIAGAYTVCVLPLPSEIVGMAAMQYAMRHGEDLPAFCEAVTVAAAPEEQAMSIEVELPPVIPDE